MTEAVGKQGRAKIVKLHLPNKPKRSHALAWLRANYSQWPYSMSVSISDDIFYGWRFIRCEDSEIVFADCIHAGITAEEFYGASKAEQS